MTTTTCERCGSFSALTPSWGRMLCDECLTRQVEDNAKSMTIGRLIAESFAMLGKLGWPVLLAAAAVGMLSELNSMLTKTLVSSRLVPSTLINSAFTAVTSDMFYCLVVLVCIAKLAHAQDTSWRAAVAKVGKNFVRLAGFNYAWALLAFGSIMCLFLPIFVVSAAWMVALPIFLVEERTFFASLREGWQRAKGSLITILFTAFLLMVVPLGIAIASGIIFPEAMQETNAVLARTALHALTHVSSLPSTCLVAVLYAKLAPGKLPSPA